MRARILLLAGAPGAARRLRLGIPALAVLAALGVMLLLSGCATGAAEPGSVNPGATLAAALPTEPPPATPISPTSTPPATAIPPTSTPTAILPTSTPPATAIPPTSTPPPTYTPRPRPTYTPRPAPTRAGEGESESEGERQPAAPFRAHLLDGSELALSDTFGTPTLLAFWAPW